MLAKSPIAEDVGAELTADVASGEITQEEADKTLKGSDVDEAELYAAATRLKDAVVAGKITQKQADERLKVRKDRLDGARKTTEWEDVEAEVLAAFRNGDITREQAAEKLEGLRAREGSRRITLEDVEARLKAGVDAGNLTQEQANERLEAWKKDQAEGLRAREDSREKNIVTDAR